MKFQINGKLVTATEILGKIYFKAERTIGNVTAIDFVSIWSNGWQPVMGAEFSSADKAELEKRIPPFTANGGQAIQNANRPSA